MIVNINGIDINYEIYGDGGETLLVLHGWMASIQAMAPIWQHFMKSRRVVVLDFPRSRWKEWRVKYGLGCA